MIDLTPQIEGAYFLVVKNLVATVFARLYFPNQKPNTGCIARHRLPQMPGKARLKEPELSLPSLFGYTFDALLYNFLRQNKTVERGLLLGPLFSNPSMISIA